MQWTFLLHHFFRKQIMVLWGHHEYGTMMGSPLLPLPMVSFSFSLFELNKYPILTNMGCLTGTTIIH